MAERTLVERLRAIAEPRFSPLLPEEVTTLREAAVALERLGELGDALERICRNDIGASFDQRYVEERVRDFASWERGFSDALSIVQRIARRALTAPAPAPQHGGSEGRCRYGHRRNGCELGHPGCICADEVMARCTGQCLPDTPGPNVCDCDHLPHQGVARALAAPAIEGSHRGDESEHIGYDRPIPPAPERQEAP